MTFHLDMIEHHVEKIKTWNPKQCSLNKSFFYIDLSSVNKDKKEIALDEVKNIQTNEAPSRARQLVKASDVLVSTVRPNLNGLALVPNELNEATASTGYCVLRANQETLDSQYLYYWVQTNIFVSDMVANSTGANYPAVSDKIIKQSKIPLPALPEQKKIAEILDAADSLRQKDQQLIEHYTALSQSLFLEMFGDPVTNSKDWHKSEFGDYIEVLTDYHANGSYEVLKENVTLTKTKDYALMVRTTDLEKNNFSEDVNYISEEAYEYLSKSKVYGGEIIVSKIGSAGKIFLMPYLNKPVSLGMNTFLLRFNKSLNSMFVYYLLTSKFGDIEIGKRIKGAVTKTIRKDALREIEIIVPSIDFQNQFAERIEAIEKQKQQAQANLEKSEALFNSLLQRAFKGELTASKAA